MKKIFGIIAILGVLASAGCASSPDWDAYNGCWPKFGMDYCAERYHIPSCADDPDSAGCAEVN